MQICCGEPASDCLSFHRGLRSTNNKLFLLCSGHTSVNHSEKLAQFQFLNQIIFYDIIIISHNTAPCLLQFFFKVRTSNCKTHSQT